MSSRERWIVYPLLFLTLGLTIRPRIGAAPQYDQVFFGDVHCRSINGGLPIVRPLTPPQKDIERPAQPRQPVHQSQR